MITTKVARIPLKVPMMLAPPANGSLSPCVAVTHVHVAGMSDDVVCMVDSSDDVVCVVDSSDDVVCVVDSEVTKTPTNVKSDYKPRHV